MKITALTKGKVNLTLKVNNPTRSTFKVTSIDGYLKNGAIEFARVSLPEEFQVKPGTSYFNKLRYLSLVWCVFEFIRTSGYVTVVVMCHSFVSCGRSVWDMVWNLWWKCCHSEYAGKWKFYDAGCTGK